MKRKRTRILILVSLLISAGFLWYSLKGTDFGAIGRALSVARLWMMLPLLAAYAVFYWVKNIRWWLLLRPLVRCSQREIFGPMMIGFMGNNILPAHLGEFVRMHLGARRLGLSRSQVLATIVLERMLDFLAIVFFLGLVLMVGRDIPERLLLIGYITAAVGVVAIVGAACYTTWTSPFIRFLRPALFFLPGKVRNYVLEKLETGAVGLAALKDLRLLAGIVLTTVVQWAAMGVSVYFAIIAVGIDVRMSAAFVTLAATTFGVTLPAAPGFLGTIQAAFVLALAPYGVSRAQAFAASAFFHVPTYLVVTLLGLWLLRGTGQRFSQIQEEAEAAKKDT